MNTVQSDLFGSLLPQRKPLPHPPAPYQRGSETSKDAAERVRPKAYNHEQATYDAIVASGSNGVTRKELAASLAFAENQQNRITGRVMSLLERGVVRELTEYIPDNKGGYKIVTVKRDGSAVLKAVR